MAEPHLKVAIAAGETSGDLLAAALMRALRARVPEVEFRGIPGPRMQAQGCQALFDIERLNVMGLGEAIPRLVSLLPARRRLARALIRWQPDVMVGVDAPDFTLGLERLLRRAGVPTVHYVSPSAWAWRQYRVRRIRRDVGLLLTLLPFEAAFFARHRVPARFVGHPLADELARTPNRSEAREVLALPSDATIVALLPGSRPGEISRIGPAMIEAARWLSVRRPDLRFVIPAVDAPARTAIESLAAGTSAATDPDVDRAGPTVAQGTCGSPQLAAAARSRHSEVARRPVGDFAGRYFHESPQPARGGPHSPGGSPGALVGGSPRRDFHESPQPASAGPHAPGRTPGALVGEAPRRDFHESPPAACRPPSERELVGASSIPNATPPRLTIIDGQSALVMRAADVVRVASGTASLETLLLERPMVVTYRVSPLTWRLGQWLLKVPYVSLPNLLAGRALVPELLQAQATPQRLGAEVLALLEAPEAEQGALRAAFAELAAELRGDAADRAAEAVLEVARGTP